RPDARSSERTSRSGNESLVPGERNRVGKTFAVADASRIFPSEATSLIKATIMAKHKYATSPPNLTGMPPGVPYIIGNEAAERFSYYGMKSVLTVFMAHYLLNQSGVLAPMSDNQAYMYSHVFVLGVYALPVLGAILADGFF